MTKCTTTKAVFQAELFPSLKHRKIKVDFNGGNVSSDGGVLLLKQIDRKVNILPRITSIMEKYDSRQPGKITHSLHSMLVQRIYGIACGYEDLNDHHTLRHDIAWQTAACKVDKLASVPTLHRFEKQSIRQMTKELMDLMIDIFIESFSCNPGEIILDFDNTNNSIHGNQEGRFFHGYYDEYCFLPLHVFCGEKMVTSLLQPSWKDGAKHAGAILKIITDKLRQKWPDIKIIYRGDSGFCRQRHLNWCDKNNIKYIIGIARNQRLEEMTSRLACKAEKQYNRTQEKAKLFCDIDYSAKSWKKTRRIIAKAEHTDKGKNQRYVVTNLDDPAQYLYEEVYCGRGNMENRIKEQKLDLFSDRTSAHEWWSNQFRMLLSAFAYILFERMRNIALKGTELAKAQVDTIRLKLLKIGAVIKRNTRSIYFSLSSSCPFQNIFWKVAESFAPG
jgi:hypothetical protein